MAPLKMANQTKLNNSFVQPEQKEAKAMFHDFLGMKAQSASPSAGATSSGGGARGVISTTSDIASGNFKMESFSFS